MRLGCSKVNSHVCHNLHVIPSAMCNCSIQEADSIHFFFTRPLHAIHKVTLHNTVAQLASFGLHTLLYGISNLSQDENKVIFAAVHKYIKDTLRFRD